MILLLSCAWAYDLNGNDWSWQDAPVEDGFELNPTSFPTQDFPESDLHAAWALGLGSANPAPFKMATTVPLACEVGSSASQGTRPSTQGNRLMSAASAMPSEKKLMRRS